jgi:hypothetical protein
MEEPTFGAFSRNNSGTVFTDLPAENAGRAAGVESKKQVAI